MSLTVLLRFPSIRRDAARPTARRRPTTLKPSLEGLEERVVLSHATALVAPTHIPVEVHALAARASQQIRVPITVTGISITDLTRDATTGVLTLAGTLTGTILGQSFTTPMSGTITPARNARSSPVLNLNLQPISLTSSGLSINASAIRLNLTPRSGGGLLGSLVSNGLNNVLSSAAGSTTAARDQINILLGNPQAFSVVNGTLGQAKARLSSFTPAQGTNGPALGLSLGPVRSNMQGLTARLDNSNNGAVTLNISTTQNGGPLGDILSSLKGNLRGRALTSAVKNVLEQISNTHV